MALATRKKKYDYVGHGLQRRKRDKGGVEPIPETFKSFKNEVK